MLEVHRTPVVRVDEAQVPHFRALVQVGHSRRGHQEGGLGERRKPSQCHQLMTADERLEVALELSIRHHAAGELSQRVLECLNRVDPRGVDLGFAGRLLQKRHQPLLVDRPGTDHRLVHEVFEVSVRKSLRPMALVVLGPTPDR